MNIYHFTYDLTNHTMTKQFYEGVVDPDNIDKPQIYYGGCQINRINIALIDDNIERTTELINDTLNQRINYHRTQSQFLKAAQDFLYSPEKVKEQESDELMLE